MSNIFVLTAGNPAARQRLRDTVENPIPKEKVEKHFSGNELDQVQKIEAEDRYYAWAATPGRSNIRNWKSIEIGDHILVYQHGKYTYYAKAIFKARNRELALENWRTDVSGQTWEYIYLLSKPIRLSPPIPAEQLSKYLQTQYMGFTKISDARISNIVKDHSSVEEYLNKVLPNISAKPKLFPNFWWVCQGKSYEEYRGFEFIWAPKTRPKGEIPYHWKNIGRVKKGDIIFNYAHGSVQAVSVAKCDPYDYFFEDVKAWDKNGPRVDIDHYPIDKIEISRLKARIDSIRAVLGEILGPFDVNGDVKQGYLFEFTFQAAKIVRQIYGKPFPEAIEKYFNGIDKPPRPPSVNQLKYLLCKKKQIILYGPPGTGKTYNTKKIALDILEGE